MNLRIFPVLGLLLLQAGITMAQTVESVIQRNAGGRCNDFTISSDGLLLAKVPASVIGNEIEIWSTKTGHLLRVIRPHNSASPGQAFLNSVNTVRFYRGNSQIITGTTNGEHEIYDVNTGRLIRKLPVKTHVNGTFAVCDRTGTMAAVHIMGIINPSSLVLLDVFSGIAFDSLQLKTGAVTALEFSPQGNALAVGTREGNVHIFNFPSFDSSRIISGIHDTAITAMQWTQDNYLLISDNKIFSLWNITTGKMQSNGYMKGLYRMVSDPKEDSFYELGDKQLLKRTGDHVRQRTFGVLTDPVSDLALDQQQKKMYIITDNYIRIWDMENLVQTDCINKNGFFGTQPDTRNVHLLPDQHAAIFLQGDHLSLKSFDPLVPDRQFPADTMHWNNFMPYAYNLPAASTNGKIIVWKDTAHTIEVRQAKGNEKILATDLASGIVVSASPKDSAATIYLPAKGVVKRLTVKGSVECAAFSPVANLLAVGGDNLYLATGPDQRPVRLYDPEKETTYMDAFEGGSSMEIPGLYTQLLFSAAGDKLYALSSWTGILKVWNVANRKIDTALSIGIDRIRLSPDGNRLFAVAGNEIIWISTRDFSIEARTAFLASGDHITILPNFLYKASANGSKAVAFKKGLNTYSFDQFDLQFNRPDLVTQQLGHPSAQAMAHMQQLLAKRWQRMQYAPEKSVSQLFEAPEVSIRNLNRMPGTVSQRKINFTVDLNDKQTPLAMVNVLINGVPALAKRNGVVLQSDTSNHTQGTVNLSVYLDSGNNVIEVYASNRKGIESQRATFEVFYQATPGSIRSTTYFIGIGAGKYADTAYNLKYPVKDVQDVARLLAAQMTGDPRSLRVKLLTDEQVSREHILALKQMLDSCSIDDKVIICWSGHGILNKSLDYYLATYNTDFSNPEQNALAYETLASLLENVSARKRVLFLDACHSGELDKDESSLAAGNGNRPVQGARSSIRRSGLRNTSSLLNDFFADIRRNSGANIISAAGGAEYALESDTWKNGVFTFCLLDALGNKSADQNGDKQISIRELQQYLQVKVPELTQGRQKPTSRTENLVSDWILWN